MEPLDELLVPQEVIDEANRALSWLSRNGTTDIDAALLQAYRNRTDVGFIAAQGKIVRLDNPPLRAYPHSTASLRGEADLSREHGKEAIRYLKTHNKILQLGTGYGRCILLLDSAQFPGNAGAEPVVLEEADLTEDITFEQFKNVIITALEEVKKLADTIEKFEPNEELLKQKEARIAELEAQIDEIQLTGWR